MRTEDVNANWFTVPVTRAINGNHAGCLSLLLKFVCRSISETNATQMLTTALFYSVRSGQKDCVAMIVKEGYPVNVTKDSTGKEPLWYALAESTDPEIARIIISSSKFSFSHNSFGSALEVAARRGNLDIMQRILFFDSQVNPDGKFWSEAVHTAVKSKSLSVLDFLLKHLKNSRRIQDVDFSAAVCSATIFKNDAVDFLTMLRSHGVTLNIAGISGTSAIIESVRNGNEEALKFLLQLQETAVDERDGRGLTALMHASRDSRDVAVVLLLQHGADPNLKTQGGKTPLFFAARNNSRSVRLLLSHNAQVNVVDHTGISPLLECVRQIHADVETARMLIEAGANVNYMSNLKSPLYYALCGNHFDLAVLLLESGISFGVFGVDEILICDTIKRLVREGHESGKSYALCLYACGGDTFRAMESYMKHFDPLEDSSKPPSMRHLCRLTVRRRLFSSGTEHNILNMVNKLPLPLTLKRYVIYSCTTNTWQ